MKAKRLEELVTFAVYAATLIGIAIGQPSSETETVNKYQKMDCLSAVQTEAIVPDVIDKVPSNIIDVIYPATGAKVKLGQELTPTQVKDFPQFHYKADHDKLYTIMFVDPDAPSRKNPTMRLMLHMLIGNIPGNNVSKGDTFAHYIGSGAPKDTGLHRYIFLLYEQKEKLVTDMKISNKSRVGRVQFNNREFAKLHNLGEPIAINFFQAQYDEYVPILHAQLASG